MQRRVILLALAAALLVPITASGQVIEITPATPLAAAVRAAAEAAPADVRNVYAPAGFQPLWTRNGAPTAQARTLIARFEGAQAKALDPADYDAGQWQHRVQSLRDDAGVAAFDVALTTTLLRYASDLRAGRVNPREVEFELDAASKRMYLPALASQLATAADVAAVLDSIEPQHREYRRLLGALERYRALAAQPVQEPLPVVAKLAPGAEYAALPQLAAILRLHGDLQSAVVPTGRTYEGEIVAAVKRFQSRHGLEPDGIIGRTTFAQLNVPLSRRVQQIEWAIERWRWVPERTGGPAIIVNIPEFRLHAEDPASGDELTMRVVVGKSGANKTPVFSSELKHVVFRPYWNVPPSIQRGEILPKLTRDASYLARNRYELVAGSGANAGTAVNADVIRQVRNGSLRVRQKPGTGNALGLVKFLFPNDNNVYLHSTPQQELFGRTRRDFSHGCIRVEDPIALAEWTLRSTEWDGEKIRAAVNGKRDDVYVRVERPVTVMILYATAAAGEDGTVQFFDDIYGHDVQLASVLTPQRRGATMLLAAR